MYGYEIDGMIDDELIEQLKQVKADKDIDTERADELIKELISKGMAKTGV